jgi:Uma2 family endonuclease
MAGATPAHVRITTNLTRLVGNQLDGKSCEPFDSDIQILVPDCKTVFYPDLAVTCEIPGFAEGRRATLLNPTLIVEVLSPSTDRVDRGLKFDCYRTLDSLQAYVLVHQDEPRIELYTRHPDGSWRFEAANGIDATIRMEEIDCELRLADIYRRVVFSDRPATEIFE